MDGPIHMLAWGLLHSVWQGALILLATVLALRGLTKSSARYRACLLALCLTPLSFGLTLLGAAVSPHTPPLVTGAGLASNAPLPFSLALLELYNAYDLSPYIVALWLLGVCTQALRTLGGTFYVRRLRKNTLPVSEALKERVRVSARTLSLRLNVGLFESRLVSVPTLVGWLRPVILLPTSALCGLTSRQLEAVLLHELAHIKRCDPFFNLLQTLCETLLFYHPAAWWLSRQARLEREHCCDDLVVAHTGDKLAYARALMRLETLKSPSPLLLTASGGHLMNRISRILGQPTPKRTPHLLLGSVLAGALLVACSSLGGGQAINYDHTSDYASACFNASVNTGGYEIPAFNEASVKAMAKILEAGSSTALVGSCTPSSLRFDYLMQFDAQSLSWKAQLDAVAGSGTVLWRGRLADAIDTNGAFQYTTEHSAQTLLEAFLANH